MGENQFFELKDSALENVSGGLLKPILEGRPVSRTTYGTCAACGKGATLLTEKYMSNRVGGLYYCDTCRPNATAAEPANGG